LEGRRTPVEPPNGIRAKERAEKITKPERKADWEKIIEEAEKPTEADWEKVLKEAERPAEADWEKILKEE
jgi:vacuolar-type H+-ATPase subunit H